MLSRELETVAKLKTDECLKHFSDKFTMAFLLFVKYLCKHLIETNDRSLRPSLKVPVAYYYSITEKVTNMYSMTRH